MFTAILVDDEIHCTETLKEKLRLYCPSVAVKAVYNDPQEALKALQEDAPDILFLDVEMPRLNGFGLLEQLGKINFEIVFTTAYDQFALQAFKMSAFDYLLKPIEKDDLIRCINKLNERKASAISDTQMQILMQHMQHTAKSDQAKIAIPTLEGLEFFYIKDILYLEGQSNYSRIYTKDGKSLLVSKTLKDFEDTLGPYHFFRIHLSYYINLTYVKKYLRGEGGSVIMENGAELDVSRRRKDEFIKALAM
ncbi:MAG: LytTR family DNA-binding domain-containing protein [Ferruginibacter sp.]